MRVGVPKEIKNHEYRVGMTPSSVAELVASGHEVFVETKAGMGIDFDDAAYEKVGATIVDTAAELFAKSDMIVKVKEPQANTPSMTMPAFHRFLLVVDRLINASSARLPPSPLLSARMMIVTYFSVTMVIIDQKIRLSTP